MAADAPIDPSIGRDRRGEREIRARLVLFVAPMAGLSRARKDGRGRSLRILIVLLLALIPVLSTGAQAAPQGEATTKGGGESTTKGDPTPPTSVTAPPPLSAPTPTGPATATGPKPGPGPGPSVDPSTSVSASGSASGSASAEPPPAPSTSESAQPKGPRTTRKLSLGVGDLGLTLKIPTDWPELPEAALPEVEPDPNQDVEVVSRKGFGVHEPKGKPPAIHEVVLVCGKAKGDYWADAIRDAAFTQMIAATEKEIGKYTTLQSIEPDAIKEDGPRILQPFSAKADFAEKSTKGKVTKGGGIVFLQGLSLIGFSENDGKVSLVACSLACAELVAAGETGVCADVIGSYEAEGKFAPPPKRSWIAELVFKLRKDPTTMWLLIVGAGFLFLVLVLVVVLLARRKRRRTTTSAEHEVWDDDHDHDDHAGPDPAVVAAELRALVASPPPREGFYDPETLARRKV